MTARWREVWQTHARMSSPPRLGCRMLGPPVPFSSSSLQSLRQTAEFHFISYIIPVLSSVLLLTNPPPLITPLLIPLCCLPVLSFLSLLHLSISMRHSSSLHLAQRRLLPLRLSFARLRSAGCAPVYMHACIWDTLSRLWTLAVPAQPWQFSGPPALALWGTACCFVFYSFTH